MIPITLAGYVWQCYPGEFADPGVQALLWLCSVSRPQALDPGVRSRAIWIPQGLIVPHELLAQNAHVIVTAEYHEREGKTPTVSAVKVEAFDEDRETTEWRRLY